MQRKKSTGNALELYLYDDNPKSRFSRVTEDLFKSKAFQSLNPAAANLYIILTVHKHTDLCNRNLYRVLREYDHAGIANIPEIDARYETDLKNGIFEPYLFVFPGKHAKEYGYTAQRAGVLLKQLQEAGFIERPFGDPPGKKQVIYKFCFDWKKKDKNPAK